MDIQPASETPETSNIVPLHAPAAALGSTSTFAVRSAGIAERKWGKEVISCGFCITPSLLLLAQRRLHLTPPQLVVLLHLMDIWWGEDELPWPSKRLLAQRIGMGERRVQSIVAELEKEKLVQRIERRNIFGAKTSNAYDLSGLVAKLKEIAPDELAARKKLRDAQAQVRRPGLRKRKQAV